MALLLGSHVVHPHMFLGHEFVLVLPPTGPWAGVPRAPPVPSAAAPARTSPCQGSSSDCLLRGVGCRIFQISAIHFLPKSGRWAGPRYEPRRNVCSAPEVNPCFPGAGSVGWEVYFQFELVGTAYNHFSLSLGAFVPNYPFSLVASDSSDMLSPGTFLWKVFYLSILFFLVVDLPQNHNNLPGQFCKSCWGIPLCNGEPDYCLWGDAPYLGYCFRFPASFL